jgi:hypothetical protein
VGVADLPAPICDLLGRLGDQRAVGALRGTLVRGLAQSAEGSEETSESSLEEQSRQAKWAAALALARLGDQEQVPVARSWAASADAKQRLKGAEILLISGAADARRALVPLFALPGEARVTAFRLAAAAPGVELVSAAGEAAKLADEPGRLALLLLGRVGGASAVARLEPLLRDPRRAWDAAYALARAPGDEARRALEVALSGPALARLAARAGVVRTLALGDEPRGLSDALRSLFASKQPADRAAGAFGLAALGKVNAIELVDSRDPAIVRAAARAALILGPSATRALARRLVVESDTTTRAALALVLAGPRESVDDVPTFRLLSWAEADEPIAPLAIAALGVREQPEQPGDERRFARWLESDDPVKRVHAALALGSSPLPSAAGRLADAWRFETDPAVRRAIVVALSQRGEPARRALEIAAKLDTDAEVRESASLGISGRLSSPLGRLGRGCSGAREGACYIAWISLVKTAPAGPEAIDARVASYVDPSGLSLPVVSDPDGALLLPGVSPGDASFHLASSVIRDDAPGHDRTEAGSAR